MEKLEHLFQQRRPSKEAVELQLWELADIIVSDYEYPEGWLPALSHEDLVTQCWLTMSKARRNYDPKKGKAFSYFYRVGRRELSYQIKRESIKVHQRDSLPEGVPITPRKAPPVTGTDPIKIADQLIRRTENEIRHYDADDDAYKAGRTGIQFLTQFKQLLQQQQPPRPI